MQNHRNSCNFSRNGPEMLLPPHRSSQRFGFDSGPSNLIAMVTGGLSTVRPPPNITRAGMAPGGPFCAPSVSCPPSVGRGELKLFRRVNAEQSSRQRQLFKSSSNISCPRLNPKAKHSRYLLSEIMSQPRLSPQGARAEKSVFSQQTP